MLVYSYFGVEKWQFALILVILVLFRHFQDHKLSWLSFLLLIPAIHLPSTTLADDALAPLKIKLVDTKIMQDYKWDYRNQLSIINDNYQHIDNAVHQGYDVVVLPESAFPLYMNQYPHIIRTLQEKSQNITIITGTLLSEASKHYNVTYIFKNKNVTIAKKTMLVPFGEYVPLPSILKEWVNKTFFNGESDFITADKKTYFDINGTQFLNAICYEALSENMYLEDNGTSPKYMIAISNNGWFLPSTEPSFQKIMIQYFANKYGTTVYHSANRAGSGIITPQ